MAVEICRALRAGVLAFSAFGVLGCGALPALAAPKSPKSTKQGAMVPPLPVLAPWHRRPAALGPGPKTTSSPKASARPSAAKTSNGAPTPPKAKSPSVSADISIDPNAWTHDDVSESLKACVTKLASVQARVEISEPFRKGACGAPVAVEVKKIGTRYPLQISPAATLRCDMVVSLYRFVEESLQPAAVALLGSPIASVEGVSSYSCRNRYGDPGGKLSEHALANALDVGTFRLANGKTVKVVSDWGPTERDTGTETDPVVQPLVAAPKRKENVRLASLDGQALTRRELRRLKREERAQKTGGKASIPPLPIKKADAVKSAAPKQASETTPGVPVPAKRAAGKTAPAVIVAAKPAKSTSEMRFLKRVHAEACQYFGTVLGPEANDAHRDHFHFDMAPRKRSNYCR